MDYISTILTEPGFPFEWEGLDFYSADDATPRLYGVSFGNGNDGVSHSYPQYYVRTNEPFVLASAALLGAFKPDYQHLVDDEMEVDGETEFTITATLYNPLSDTTKSENSLPDDDVPDDGDESEDDGGSWCDANGAYMIVEVFRVDSADVRDSCPLYDSLSDCFADAPELVRAIARKD